MNQPNQTAAAKAAGRPPKARDAAALAAAAPEPAAVPGPESPPGAGLPPIAPPLLEWFYAHRRSLPFREHPTPYRVWVSEIMLQQTRVSAALPYYERFLAALPTVEDLAACPEEKLHKLWEGLGYYSRVRNLQKAARLVVQQHGGALPADYDALRRLPGIGDYTAGAIASICFGIPAPAVDGNVLRVFSRLYNDDRNILEPAAKRAFTARVMAHQPPDAPGPYNEALMELGALVCLPGGEPLCAGCPLAPLCRGRAAGRQRALPVKTKPKARRVQRLTVFAVFSPAGVLLQRRPDTGLLAGLWQPPLAEGVLTGREAVEALAARGLPGARLLGPLPRARHIFSHIEWQMQGWRLACPAAAPLPDGFVWASGGQLQNELTLPGAFSAYRGFLLAGPGPDEAP